MENKMPSYSKLRYLAAVLLFISVGSKSQNIDKHFVSNLQENGVLYFIMPQKGFETERTTVTYDITYLCKTDSAKLNFSVIGNKLLLVQAIELRFNNKNFVVPTKKLFIESRKKDWVARYSATIAYKDLQQFFDSESIPTLSLQNQDGTTIFSCKEKQWRKISAINKKIFQVINYNV